MLFPLFDKRSSLALGGVALAMACSAVTLRPEATKEALINPGMGWIHYHFDNSNWNYGADTPVGDTLDWFPGVSTIYFRIPWRDLEPVEGDFRWDVIDSVAQPWIAAGKQVAFRFTCNESGYEWAVPEWLPAAGAKGRFMLMKKKPEQAGFRLWEPEWLDPVFLEKYGNFLAAAARRWDGNPSVAFIDVGSFGMWGEGHTGFTSKIPPDKTREFAIEHAKLLKRHFARTPIVISDDVAGSSNPAPDDPCMKAMREMGIGFRDDSIMVAPRPRQWFHAGWARTFAAAGLPVVVETRHFYADYDRDNWYEGGLLESTVAYQASYQAIHWWPDEHLQHHRKDIEATNLRLGYRFELREVTWPEVVKMGDRVGIDATWVNVGVARPREEAMVAWTLLDDRDVVHWTSVDETFDLRGIAPTLEDGEHPVSRTAKVRFGWDWPYNGLYYATGNPEIRHDGTSRRHGPRVVSLKPGVYTLCVSVGRRDGTPRVALPLDGQVGKTRRYRLGAVRVK